ncbi:MAG: hypothetical protein AB2L07_05730 [Thermoanaerobaculaceae bacterium]
MAPTTFRAIRHWEGSQHRAFEELCFQLLREPEDLPAPDARPVRVGNPDGGVEWYVDLPDGTQWGWQAKYTTDLNTLIGETKKSVERVAKARPDLTRLTVCAPMNLSGAPKGNGKGSARDRFFQAVERWKTKIQGGDSIEVVLVGESELLERLARPKHRGRMGDRYPISCIAFYM